MFGSFTRDERNILLAIMAMLAAGYAAQTFFTSPVRTPLTASPKPVGQSRTPAPLSSTGSVRALNSTTAAAESANTTQTALGSARSADGLLDLNLAMTRHFEELPGIGPGRAKDIVAYRTANGPFQSVDQLDLVPGIGPATMERLRPLVTVQGHSSSTSAATTASESKSALQPRPVASPQATAQPEIQTNPAPRTATSGPSRNTQARTPQSPAQSGLINVNAATAEQLEQLDRIGPALAQKIVQYRSQHGPFQTPEALLAVPGIGPKILERNLHRISVR